MLSLASASLGLAHMRAPAPFMMAEPDIVSDSVPTAGEPGVLAACTLRMKEDCSIKLAAVARVTPDTRDAYCIQGDML